MGIRPPMIAKAFRFECWDNDQDLQCLGKPESSLRACLIRPLRISPHRVALDPCYLEMSGQLLTGLSRQSSASFHPSSRFSPETGARNLLELIEWASTTIYIYIYIYIHMYIMRIYTYIHTYYTYILSITQPLYHCMEVTRAPRSTSGGAAQSPVSCSHAPLLKVL